MKAFRRVLHAATVRDAIEQIPEVFYERFALVFLAAWIVAPLPLWWVGNAIGMPVSFLSTMSLQVGMAALVLAALLFAARLVDAASMRDRPRDNLPLALLGVFVALALVATIVHPTDAAWTGDGYRHESIWTYVSSVGFFFLASQVLTAARRRLLIGIVLGLVLVTCLATLIPALVEGWATGEWPSLRRASAYFSNSNHFGYLLAIGGALAGSGALVARRRAARWTLLLVFAIVLLALLLNDTLGAYVALLAGLVVAVVWLAVMRRLHLTRVVAIVVVAVAVHVGAEALGTGTLAELGGLGSDVQEVSVGGPDADSAGSGRWALWTVTVEQIVASPWLGHGVEGVAEPLSFGYGRPHNEYLQYAAFFGIPALLAYVAALIAVLVRVVRCGAHVDAATVCTATAALTYLISACFGNTMYYTTPLLFVLLGLTWAGVRRKGVGRGDAADAAQAGAPDPRKVASA